ncbi:MAG: DUF192 domain-containing protein [Beijerinckiaceae bacterium]|nr:DUF192 domain-containing protein [Beijerinckiaceae bacterium]MCZ8301373.1 DUF192 domain-containing protein [Beijerinckiaceae bacterium]
MSEKLDHTKAVERGKARSRVFIFALVVVLVGVIGISLTTNLNRMYQKWEETAKNTQGASGQGGSMAGAGQLERLEIQSGDRRHIFNVEVARNDAQRARGLMFRQSMPQDQGMLFDFERDQLVTMWMKNTYLSLDMIFIFADGRVHRIESRTEPESEKMISSGVPVRAVLELNANVANRLGLKPGDRIIHPMFR